MCFSFSFLLFLKISNGKKEACEVGSRDGTGDNSRVRRWRDSRIGEVGPYKWDPEEVWPLVKIEVYDHVAPD